MDRGILKQVLVEQRDIFVSHSDGSLLREALTKISDLVGLPHIVVITGHRRSGKSVFLSQIFKHFYRRRGFYLNLEDERLFGLSLNDMQVVMELWQELFGSQRVVFLDEVQNLEGWERFVNRLHRDGYKVYITGSNAYLLSSELSSLLTGRHVDVELFPFSFREFLAFRGLTVHSEMECYKTETKARILSGLEDYLTLGGFPEMVKYRRAEILTTLFSDVIARDVLGRYSIRHPRQIRDLSAFLISNVTREISYNKIKNAYGFASVHTVKEYVDHLCSTYLFFEVPKFSFSVRERQVRSKKIYAIDTGLVRVMRSSPGGDEGRLYENLIFLHLRRWGKQVFFYKSRVDREIDFVEWNGRVISSLQVSLMCDDDDVLRRELMGLWAGVKELGLNEGIVLCLDEEGEKMFRDIKVRFVPIWKFLLFGG